ncbi:MAG: OmpA family protein [Methylococcales bacterium]|nr:OmpA family protein [Methylococcales bacterium]
MNKCKISGLIVFLISSVCNAEYITTPLLNADWNLNKGQAYCQLKQTIPFYGEADFMQQSGELLRFSIKENRFKPAIVKASLTVETPSWLHQSKSEEHYLVTLEPAVDIQSHPRLSVYGETAEAMLDALIKGLSPTFSYRREANSEKEQTKVSVSSVKFLEQYQRFFDCRKDFLQYGFKEALEKSIFFKQKSNSLNSKVIQQLQDTVRYVKKIKGAGVTIISDTEIAGKQDKAWFIKRANKIIAKLNQLGLPKNKVSINRKIQSKAKGNKVIQLRVFGPDALETIYYRKGNINLTQTEKERLGVLAQYAKVFLPDSQIVIKSHTDSKGSRANNLRVSQKRGDVVKQFLLSIGIDEKKLIVKAYGETRPATINRFERGRARNRRVNIDFVG